MSDLYNISHPTLQGYDEVVTVSLSLLSYATCTDQWGNSEEGREHLASMVLHVNGPKPHEIEKVAAVFNVRSKRKEFTLCVKRDPCPVLFFGGTVCPLCGAAHPT